MIGYFENRNEIELKFASREKKAPVNKGVNFHIRFFKFTFLSIRFKLSNCKQGKQIMHRWSAMNNYGSLDCHIFANNYFNKNIGRHESAFAKGSFL